jgi:TnpA family transposase
MVAETRRLTILSSEEISSLYDLPKFNDDDRRLYFDLSTLERDAVDRIHTAAAGIHLALQLGYFKAKRRFFVYEASEVADDVAYIVRHYFANKPESEFKTLSKPTRLEQQKIILQLFGYRVADQAAKEELEQKAKRFAMLSTQPIFIMREALQFLESQRVITPGYTYMQDMVGRAVTNERNRITGVLTQSLTQAAKEQLDALLEADEQLYRISALKREARDFSYKELKQEVERRKFFYPLHEFAKIFLASSGLSIESGKYYASLVKFYTVYKLQRMPQRTTRLYLLCFAYHRFRQINDNLIEAFIHLVYQYEKLAKRTAEEALQKAMDDVAGKLQAAGEVLNLFIDTSISNEAPFLAVKEQAFDLLEQEQFPIVANYLRNIAFDKAAYEWAYYTTLSHQFKRNLRHLFCELDFAGRVEDAPLLEAVKFLQTLLREGKSPRQTKPSLFPAEVIPKGLQLYLFTRGESDEEEELDEKKTLNVDRYEFLLYRLLRNALEAGNLFVKDSVEFRRFEDDLISDERWQDKEAVLAEIGALILLDPIEDTLGKLKHELESTIEDVNRRITDAVNEHIKVRGRGEKRRWTLIYPSDEEPVNSPFYGKLPGIGIADLLWFVHQRTGFLKSFSHVLDRYAKHDPDPRELLACIVAMGTNMGVGKMAEVSGMGFNSLLNAARNFLRQETLHAANDVISNATATLSAFHLYDIRDEVHSSSDGQRIETQIDTANARHSPKYFGLQKGVSSYTMVANHVPVNAKIIGTHEHESHYVFDLLYNNTSDIRPEFHSTDTHGTNQVNFWILHVFGYQFAPRYRDLHKKMERLVGFQNPSEYGELLIKPTRKVYEDLIVSEWPNVQRIMASLAQKDVTQATIIRKLSSYTRQNQTKKALWELDNIRRTIYILKFIDDVTLRQSVQKALNRGEAYHRFRKSVAYVNNGKFRVKTEAEQNIWNECSRLIANAIIYYNTELLSKVYEQKRTAGDEKAIEVLRGVSPVAWRHVNLIGKFEFTDEAPFIDLDALAARYAEPGYWSKALEEGDEGSLA